MRFAYIDSQGNEVTIPSVDALALRIELGAISPETELYDAQSDRWGPAQSHEIYHTLSRDAAGEDFLIPTPLPPEPSPEEPSISPPAEPEDPGDLGLTLTPSDEIASEGPTGAEPSEPRPAVSGSPDPGLEDFAFDLAAAAESEVGEGAEEPADPSPDEGFDGGMLDLDEGPSGLDAVDSEDRGSDKEGGLDFERTLDFGAARDEDFEGGLDLEPPMSEFDPSAPPAWMEQEGPGGFGDEPIMDFSTGLDDVDEDEGARSEWSAAGGGVPGVSPDRPRPAPPSTRPPPRRPAPRRSFAKPILLLLLAGAVAGGGWYGWQQLGGRVVPPPPRPAVVIPELPAELEPPMREIAEAALDRAFARIEDRAFQGDVPAEPNEDWLAGVYLGNASDFGDVAAFWTSMQGFADRLRDEEVTTFHDAYLALADSSELDAEVVSMVVERADSGFMATQDARFETYALLGAVADASLALHEFLLTNEAEIVYTPARGFAGNPIEEAVPATEELGDRMWTLVEDITSALDRLGTLDRVTRERLNAVVLARIREVGIR